MGIGLRVAFIAKRDLDSRDSVVVVVPNLLFKWPCFDILARILAYCWVERLTLGNLREVIDLYWEDL